MARKKKHEEHTNHEAWAIPYGDLVTLLLALFVVMYAMSSVNEGKFRVLSDALIAAFRGAPKTMTPISVGQASSSKGGDAQMQGVSPTMLMKLPDPRPIEQENKNKGGVAITSIGGETPPLARMEQQVEKAMEKLIDKKLVVVRRSKTSLEVEIRTDILFASGVATISPAAIPVLQELSGILKPFSNAVRVEGHTDNVPIARREFPSNWELSAARAASVVHLFTQQGMDPKRMEIIGLGEYRPIAPNDTVEGRNTNRRVVVVILDNPAVPGVPGAPGATGEPNIAPGTGGSAQPATATPAPDKTVLAEPKK